jgi:hypothetical protein
MDVVNINLVGNGFRSCRACLQDWWIDIDYKYHKNAPQKAADAGQNGLTTGKAQNGPDHNGDEGAAAHFGHLA